MWEIFERVVRRSINPTVNISKLGRFNFNGAATKILHDNAVESVLLMWDKDARRIGIRRVGKKEARAYTVHYTRKNAYSGFAAKTFLVHIGYDYSETTTFQVDWNEEDGTFVFSLSTAENKQQVQHSPGLARSKKQVEPGVKARAEVG